MFVPFTSNCDEDERPIAADATDMSVTVILRLCVTEGGVIGYDLVDVVICTQPETSRTLLITYQNTRCHQTDDNSLDQFLSDSLGSVHWVRNRG